MVGEQMIFNHLVGKRCLIRCMSSMLRVIQQRCAFHKPLISKHIYSYALPQSELLGNGAITPLVLAVRCNTAQYLGSGPLFVGMSGVGYGLLGDLWMMTRGPGP